MAYDFKIKVTDKADNDLEEIFKYLTDNDATADSINELFLKIKNTFYNLSMFPKCGKVVFNRYAMKNNIRKINASNYIIFYNLDLNNDIVYILRIVNDKMDINAIIKELGL